VSAELAKASDEHGGGHGGGRTWHEVNGHVVSPDQVKTLNRKWPRIGAFVTAVIMLLMLIGNQKGHVEDIFLIGTAALLIGAVVADWLLRKNGLRA
jgi:uncharacterized protein DUF2631